MIFKSIENNLLIILLMIVINLQGGENNAISKNIISLKWKYVGFYSMWFPSIYLIGKKRNIYLRIKQNFFKGRGYDFVMPLLEFGIIAAIAKTAGEGVFVNALHSDPLENLHNLNKKITPGLSWLDRHGYLK